MCPINWNACEKNSENCRVQDEKCKERVVTSMLKNSNENFNNTASMGFLIGITNEKIAKSCEVEVGKTWVPKSGASSFKTDKRKIKRNYLQQRITPIAS